MTRAQTLLVTTVLAVAIPFASAVAQTGGASVTKCGPETWSTDKMAYVGVPCVGGEAAVQGTVGAAAPSVYGSNSTTYTKAQMKDGNYYGQSMPTQPVSTGAAYASMGDQSCGASNAVAITDEFHHKYNCRGDRIR